MPALRFVVLPALLLALAAPTVAQGAADAADAAEAAPDRVAVQFSRIPEGLAVHGHLHGAEVLAVDEVLGFAVVDARDAPGFRGAAARRSDVVSLESDPIQPLAAFTPNDPLYASSQYGPQLIGAPAAWELATGSSPSICIVDSGIRASHADLADKLVAGIDLVNGDADPADDFGHGTHVAGIAAASTNNGIGVAGIAPSQLLVAKALDASGNGALSTVASAIRWCADTGAKVISLSLGSPSGASTLASAVDYAWSRGAILAAAAGNGNSCVDCVQYPARYTNVIAVGCVDQNRVACAFASTGPEIDLAAPGNAIQSTWWTSDAAYTRAGGTSMSTPHVAGAAALVWAAHPEYSNVQVRQALESGAQDVAAAGKDPKTGFGLVRADLAIAVSPAPAPTPDPAPVAGVAISPASQAKTVATRGVATYVFTVQNTGSANDTLALSVSGLKSGWSASLSAPSVSLAANGTATVQLTVTAPAKVGSLTLTVTAASGIDATVKATATAKTTVAK